MVTSPPPPLVFLGKLKNEQSDGKSFEKELDVATCSLVSVSHRRSIFTTRLRLTRMPHETSGQTRETGPDRLSVSPAIRCVSRGTWGAFSVEGKRGILDRTRGGTAFCPPTPNFIVCLREYESLRVWRSYTSRVLTWFGTSHITPNSNTDKRQATHTAAISFFFFFPSFVKVTEDK